jgi:hypothetical protein
MNICYIIKQASSPPNSMALHPLANLLERVTRGEKFVLLS